MVNHTSEAAARRRNSALSARKAKTLSFISLPVQRKSQRKGAEQPDRRQLVALEVAAAYSKPA